MEGKRPVRGLAIVATGVALALALSIIWLAPAGHASPNLSVHCVNQTGTGCDPSFAGCYSSVQAAVDAADGGDEIRIAGGTYTGAAGTVALITEALSLIGAHDPSCNVHNPEGYSTVLDGQDIGTVVKVTSAGEVSLTWLTLAHGNGTGNCPDGGCGGGIYVDGSTLHLGRSILIDNVAEASTGSGIGGGLYATDSFVDMWESQVVANTAGADPGTEWIGMGGGVYILGGTASLRQNLISENLADLSDTGVGGGVYLDSLFFGELLNNVFEANRATPSGDSFESYGGGLYAGDCSGILIEGNRFQGNSAKLDGGGLSVISSKGQISRNRIVQNASSVGGGMWLASTEPVTLTNNLIVGNSATLWGGGLVAGWSRSPGSRVYLVNNTIADNGDAGVTTWEYGTLTLDNNVIAGHSVGITATHPASSTFLANTNLLWNDFDPIGGSNPILDDPRFGFDYRPRPSSLAIDGGLPIPWLTVDLEGEPRPQNMVWDLGAYEGAWEVPWRVMLPLVARDYALIPLFSDDFEGVGLPGAWTPNNGIWTNPGGHMRGQYALGNAWNIRSSTGTNIDYEGTVNLLDGNAAGLTFGSSADGTTSYDVILDAVDQVFKISRRPPYSVLGSAGIPVQRNQPYRVRVIVRGDSIEAHLDGNKLLQVSDPTYGGGHLGVILFQATAAFDDLEAWHLP